MVCDRALLNYELARKSLEHLTVSRCVHYLTYIFDCGSHEIYASPEEFVPGHGLYEATTPIKLATRPYLAGGLAAYMEIQFWGGPPDNADWHQGTLLTMLIDRLFYCVAKGYEDTVTLFLETLNDNSKRPSHDKTPQATSTTVSSS